MKKMSVCTRSTRAIRDHQGGNPMQSQRPSNAITEAIQCNHRGHPMQSKRRSKGIKEAIQGNPRERMHLCERRIECELRGTQLNQRPSVAMNACTWASVGSSGNSTILRPSDVRVPVLSMAERNQSWYIELSKLSCSGGLTINGEQVHSRCTRGGLKVDSRCTQGAIKVQSRCNQDAIKMHSPVAAGP